MHRIYVVCLLLSLWSRGVFAQDTLEPGSVTQPQQSEQQTILEKTDDPARDLQSDAILQRTADFGHWGHIPGRYSTWINHSNRLVPVYTFGLTLDSLRDEGSVYSDPERLKKLYGRVPEGTVNPTALYFDQTDVYVCRWPQSMRGTAISS